MNANFRISYRALFWAAIALTAITLVAPYASRETDDPRQYDPHRLSELRGVAYPFTIEVYGYKYAGKTGDYIDDHILAYGAYEKDVLFFMKDYVEARGNPDAVFLDVGACEGQHSLFMSRLVKQVHAFEPFPPAIARFRSLVALNAFSNIRLHEVGLGSEDATVPFFGPPAENIGSGTFLPEHKQGADQPIGRLRVVAGDESLASLGLASLDVVKVDVEGFEKPVLQGLRRSLGRYRPVLVIETTHPPRGSIGSIAELKRLLPQGYRLLRFRSSRADVITGDYHLEEIARLAPGLSYEMVVAYPEERDPLIHRRRPSRHRGTPAAPAAQTAAR